MAAKVTFHSRCAWCGQPKIANVHPTHGTSIACVEALKAELRRAEEAGIDAIRAVSVQLEEVTAERDRLAERLAMATEFRDDEGVIAVHAPQQWRVHFGRRRGPDGRYFGIFDTLDQAFAALAAAREVGSGSTGAAEDATEPETPSP